MAEQCVGVLGATSLVGDFLLPLLAQQGWRVVAFSRRAQALSEFGVEWRQVGSHAAESDPAKIITTWVSAAPIWILPKYFGLLEASGARIVVALSSTSIVTKQSSRDSTEQSIAWALHDGERRLTEWARERDIRCVILRPTLIYGNGRDKNVTEIARFILRFGFFPLLGAAHGQRQPLHAADVAQACAAALQSPATLQEVYQLSGGETLSYREMVGRIFVALGRPPAMPELPLWPFRLAVLGLRCFPRFRHWNVAMAERMSCDQVFDHTHATHDLGFAPRKFQLTHADLPS
jgi:nucleoside-diphosphate-sugar epimerase